MQLKFKQIFTLIILILVGSLYFYLRGFIGFLQYLLFIGTYIIFFYSIHFLWIKMRKKKLINFYIFIQKFLYSISWIFFILFLIIGGFVFTYNNIIPAVMPEYTLTNGDKIIKFQAMVHIGKQSFYDKIILNLINFKKEGGVYFYEGVRPGNIKNMEKFNQALGVEFSEDLYVNFSKLYGVTFQNNNDFLGLINNLDFNIDLNMDQIIELYDEKINLSSSKKEINLPIDVNKEIKNILSTLNNKEQKILIYINQAILNFFMSNNSILESATNSFANKELFDVILNERNKLLVDSVYNYDYKKIFITYGLLHFKGFYELLKEKDPNWRIIGVDNLYPIGNKE